MLNKVRSTTLLRMKAAKEPIAALTCYDYPSGRALDAAGVDVALVGDSLGMVVLGHTSTLPVTLEDMIHHCRAARRGVNRAMLVADLPFMSYQISPEQALESAGRLIKEGGAEAVKLEGGLEMADTVRTLRKAGIAVMGHVGLTPQSVHALGGYRRQGTTPKAAKALLASAKALEKAGAFAVVLEVMGDLVAKKLSRTLKIPTLGIGSGPFCDGQILVTHDALGLTPDRVPGHAKIYARLYDESVSAAAAYVRDVKNSRFPKR
jgi:3-methyl-2-oxobutanoate hydroxymethyltransferase